MKYISINDRFEIIKEQFPIIKDISEVASDSSRIYSGIKKFIEIGQINKIKSFIESIEIQSNIEIIGYIDDMNDDEKVFFTQTINKVIDLDDSLQIYLLAYLTKQYMINKEKRLDYYEKQLYYNIGTFSTDDFEIFYSMYKEKILSEKNKSIRLSSRQIYRELLGVSLKKFSNIGLLNYTAESESFKPSEYSERLYKCLDSYSENLFSEVVIEEMPNTISSTTFIV